MAASTVILAGCNLGLGSSSSSSSSGDVTFTWVPPAERVNGEPLPDNDIAGFLIRHRSPSETRFNQTFVEHCKSNQCSHTLQDIPNPDQQIYRIATVDSSGLYSRFVDPTE